MSKEVNGKALRASCGDCLRVKDFATWQERDAFRCPCGAPEYSYCSSPNCAALIDALEAGLFDHYVVRPDIDIRTWTTEGGAICETVP
ncbi:hypothetical protein [Sphingomonas azotifigens]|uniref:hypothetical protein n=1 Tax=Sphingomonas azotifigens TaxID=330920 RepID=UPI0009FD2C1C|nr:hypothetical protein [Sphingomonas azotifigens]